jgi:hypothetical protein
MTLTVTLPRLVRACAALLASTALVTAQERPAGASNAAETVDEPHGAMLERLSPSGIRGLYEEGNLVDWPAADGTSAGEAPSAAAVALDQRVGANIRLGDDPAALPEGLRAQAEPHIARSPADPDFLVATFQEGRFTDGSAVNCGYSISRDGGLTWTRALIPGTTASTGGPYPRLTDPVAAVGSNGFVYLNTLAAGSSTRVGEILVNRSTNGGASFEQPVVAYKAPSVNVFPDKNWIAVNTFANTPTAGRIVVTFTAFPAPGQQGPTPIMRVYSDDHGVTWSPAAFVHASTTIAQSSLPVFLPDGKLAIVYWNFNTPGSTTDDFLEMVVSNDGGNTFEAPRPVQAVPTTWNHPQIRDGFFTPSVTADRVNGNIYVAYQARLNGPPRIVITRSSDAGATWSSPIAVSDNPSHSGVFNPAIATSPDGKTLTVVYQSNRDNLNNFALVDVYLAQSFDGGVTWQPNIRLTSVSTDATLSPLTSAGHMLGDYHGVAESTNPNVPAVAVWIDNRTGNPDPFVARVGIAPQANFASWQASRLSFAQINNPALGGQAGDADNDGEDNLSEFVRGTDPNDPLSVFRTARPVNISTRAVIADGDNVLIGGFIVSGSEPKNVIARAIGPSLTQFGVPNALEDPTLQLVPQNAPPIFNNNWQDTNAAAVQATGLAPSDPRESAIVATLNPGNYTAIVRSGTGNVGTGLVEIYDLTPEASARFGNLSSRGRIFPGENNVMIGGVIVGAGGGVDGAGSTKVVVRAIGPTLGQFGVADALQDPELLVFDANANIVASNDNWGTGPSAGELVSLQLAPNHEREGALVATLRRGNYTAIVRGVAQSTGVGLVEVYYVPPTSP